MDVSGGEMRWARMDGSRQQSWYKMNMKVERTNDDSFSYQIKSNNTIKKMNEWGRTTSGVLSIQLQVTLKN